MVEHAAKTSAFRTVPRPWDPRDPSFDPEGLVRLSRSILLVSILMLGASCSSAFNGKDDDPKGKGSDTDADTDADADTDTDSDADTDADTDTDIDPDTTDDDGDGLSEDEGDCDDTDASASPELDETPYDGVDNDCDESTPDDDLDGDGADLADDCDDEDSSIGPHVDETPYDGIDNDCDSATPDDDIDGDGYLLEDDCDDNNDLVNPGVDEVLGNSTDDDCDGLTDERFDYETLDDSCDCGISSAIATDSANQVWLAYYNNDDGTIWTDQRTAAGVWTGSSELSVVSGYWVGEYMDGEVDNADQFQLTYTAYDLTYGYTSLDFQYADASGTWSGDYVVDDYWTSGSTSLGYFVDLAIDSSNLPSFAYYDETLNYPIVADYTSFGVAITVTADFLAFTTSDPMGYTPGLDIDSNGYDHVVFYDGASPYGTGLQPENQYSSFTGGLSDVCFSSTVDNDGLYNSVKVKSDDTVCVAYMDSANADLKYACNTGSCAGWSTETVDSVGSVGLYAQLAFNSADEPYIAYYDETNAALKVAHHDGTGWSTFTVDDSASVGEYVDMAIDGNDLVHLSYYDADNMALKYAVGE